MVIMSTDAILRVFTSFHRWQEKYSLCEVLREILSNQPNCAMMRVFYACAFVQSVTVTLCYELHSRQVFCQSASERVVP